MGEPTQRRPARRASRSASLFRFDRALDARLVAGTDEAGRGCLAGPLVAAAVVFDLGALGRLARRELSGLDDSKRLSAGAREELAGAIIRHATAIVVRSACAPNIDRDGLHQTNLRLLGECLAAVDGRVDVRLVDGFALPRWAPEHRAVVGGDARSAAIAAASVIAKTTRDRMMCGPAAERWPAFGFHRHVGYATRAHQAALREVGLSPIHRRSFNSSAYPTLSLFDAGEWDRTRPDGG